ncbi:MAG: hypothetical protein AAB560_01180 [Patescibacteria group bacterium]
MATEWREWFQRFTPVAPGISLELAFVFTGEVAEIARGISWNDDFRHHAPPRQTAGSRELAATHKIYIVGDGSAKLGIAVFDFAELARQTASLNINEAFCEWTLLRDENCRAICGPRPEKLWGFGRPHPDKPDFKPHHLLAGPVVDYRSKPGWVFRPVFIKTRFAYLGYSAKISPNWFGNEARVGVVSEFNPEDIPEALRDYQFAPAGVEKRLRYEKAKALEAFSARR